MIGEATEIDLLNHFIQLEKEFDPHMADNTVTNPARVFVSDTLKIVLGCFRSSQL
jgi:hypothetical protein